MYRNVQQKEIHVIIFFIFFKFIFLIIKLFRKAIHKKGHCDYFRMIRL